jgi:cell wall-associated NlpC family hydrolase
MITGADIVREARSLIGTKFHHQGRVPGCGVDCVGLAVVVAERLGLQVVDRTDYPPETDGEALQEALEASCDPTPEGAVQEGDVLQFRRGRSQWHVGIVAETGPPRRMVHALARHVGGRVVEEPVPIEWARRLVGVWRIKGVIPWQP